MLYHLKIHCLPKGCYKLHLKLRNQLSLTWLRGKNKGNFVLVVASSIPSLTQGQAELFLYCVIRQKFMDLFVYA